MKSGRSVYFWSDEETEFMLVQLKELNILKFMDGRRTRNGDLFKKAQKQMASAGYKRSPEQIRVRWKHLKQAYFSARKNNQTSDHAPVSCSFSGIMEELLGCRPLSQAGRNGVDFGFSPPVSETTSGRVDALDETMEPSPPAVEPISSSSSSTESSERHPVETLDFERSSTPALLDTSSTAAESMTPVRRRRPASDMDAVFERLQTMQASWMQAIQQSQDREERLVNNIVESNASMVSTLLEGIRSFQPSVPAQPKEEPIAWMTEEEAPSPEAGLESALEISQEKNGDLKLEQENRQQDGEMACPSTDVTSNTQSPQWSVGDQCQVVWSEDGQEYLATVAAVDGERCRVRFNGYGNEEDMQLSVLQSLKPDLQTENSQTQDWKPGSRCRAVYSEDGLVYPAVVLWVKGQRCRIRYDNYNNEEEQDISKLLSTHELHGPIRATTGTGSSRKSSSVSRNSDHRRMSRDESQGKKGRERLSSRDDQLNSFTVKERPTSQSRVVKEADEEGKTGDQQREGAEKLTSHRFPLFPPFPPSLQTGSWDSMPFLPPPPPAWMTQSKEAGGSVDVETVTDMLKLWYMCGFYTGSCMAQLCFKSNPKE